MSDKLTIGETYYWTHAESCFHPNHSAILRWHTIVIMISDKSETSAYNNNLLMVSTIINGSNNLFHSASVILALVRIWFHHPLPAHNIKFERNTYIIVCSGSADSNQHNSDNGYPQTNDNYSLEQFSSMLATFSLYAEDLILNEHWKTNAGLHFSFLMYKNRLIFLQSRLSISFKRPRLHLKVLFHDEPVYSTIIYCITGHALLTLGACHTPHPPHEILFLPNML